MAGETSLSAGARSVTRGDTGAALALETGYAARRDVRSRTSQEGGMEPYARVG